MLDDFTDYQPDENPFLDPSLFYGAGHHDTLDGHPLSGHEGNLAYDHAYTIGSPDHNPWTHQTTGFTCDVVSQKMILDAFGAVNPATGADFSEAQLVYEATSHGWLSEGGTNLDDMGKLLEFHGVANHYDQGMPALIEELAHGHKVIVDVNSDKLWNHDPLSRVGQFVSDIFSQKGGNHAVVIEGVRVDENGHAFAVVNDPGQPDGANNEYPMEDFVNAFKDSHFTFVATDHAPPGLASHELLGHGFNPERGEYTGWQSWASSVGEFVKKHAAPMVVYGGLTIAQVLNSAERKSLLRRI